jgi:hypothetical protein
LALKEFSPLVGSGSSAEQEFNIIEMRKTKIIVSGFIVGNLVL